MVSAASEGKGKYGDYCEMLCVIAEYSKAMIVDNSVSVVHVAQPVDGAPRPDMAHVSTTQIREGAIRRGHTISAVTAEAGAVFEHVIQRSHSDSSSSASHRARRRRPRKPLTAIQESGDGATVGRHLKQSVDHWTTDVTQDSIDTRLSSYTGVDKTDGRLSHSSGDGILEVSRGSIDVFDTRLSSTDGLDDPRMSGALYSQQLSRDSGDLLASSAVSGRQTTDAPSMASMSVDGVGDITDADDESRQKKASAKKKKKSVFRRVRERLRATFSRDEDRSRAERKASKYMRENGDAGRPNWITSSFRRRKKRPQMDHASDNGTTLASNLPGSSIPSSSETHSRHAADPRETVQDDQSRSKGWLSSLQRRISSVRVKRSRSRGSGMLFHLVTLFVARFSIRV